MSEVTNAHDLIAFYGYFHVHYYRPFMSKLLHQTFVSIINTQIFIYQYAKCDCKLWKILWFNWVFGDFQILFYKFGTLELHQTFTNCVLRQMCRDETFVIIYGYVSLVPKFWHEILWTNWIANNPVCLMLYRC